MKRVVTTLVAGMLFLVFGSAGVSAAAYNPIEPEYTAGEDGQCTVHEFSVNPGGELSNTDDVRLVVTVQGSETLVAEPGEAVTVGPFGSDQKVWFRTFGGPERDYDSPQWEFENLEFYLKDNPAEEWVLAGHGDAPARVTWHTKTLKGDPCPVEVPTPSFDDAECVDGELVPARVGIPEHDMATYTLNGELKDPGEYEVEGEVVVEAQVDKGYEVDGQDRWEATTASPGCGEDLPDTGAPVALLALLGGSVAAVGGALTRLRR